MKKQFTLRIPNPLFGLYNVVRMWRLPNYGTCLECKKRRATHDYNGHKHYVCEPCNDRLNREFNSGDW
jgi:transposase-like protein